MEVTLNNAFRHVCALERAPEAEVKALGMLYRGDLDFAYLHGGPLVGRFLDAALRDVRPRDQSRFAFATVDSRVHLLFPGMYPCIPGWHCDDFYRPEPTVADEPGMGPPRQVGYRIRGIAQPRLSRVEAEAPAIHYAVVYGSSSLTEWMTDLWPYDVAHLERDEDDDDSHALGVYQRLDGAVGAGASGFATRLVADGEVVAFGPLDVHRCSRATSQGWRAFVRLTLSNHLQPANEIRRQTQVYLPADRTVSW